MNLPTLLLACINRSEDGLTGYDLTKKFSEQLFFIWSANHQQVYRELNKMAEQKHLSCRLEPQDGKPDRKIYTITESGKRFLSSSLPEKTPLPVIRDTLSANLFAAESANKSDSLWEHLERQQASCSQRLDKLNKQRELIAASGDLLELLLIDRQIGLLQAEVEWLIDAHEKLCA